MPITTNPDSRRSPPEPRLWLTEGEIVAFVVIHLPLSVLLRQVSVIATVHALGAVLLGLLFASRDRRPDRVVAVIAYVCANEVLWRGGGARIFWEYGKYASLALACAILLRFSNQFRKPELAGLVYALAMLPSLAALPYFDRKEVAFNVAGPITLGLLAFALSGVQMDPRGIRTALAALLAPSLGLGLLSAVSTVQVQDFSEIQVGGKATTAGIGPNQVSAALGLGALAAVLLLLMVKKRSSRIPLMLMALWLLAQSMLSLSRGGFWGALIPITAGSLVLLRQKRLRKLVLAGSLILAPTFQYVVFPVIDGYTGGLVSSRFRDTRTTGRDKIAQADWITFLDKPVLGVGPGQSKYYHEMTFRISSSHTEYSRLLAEHGSLGVVAMLLLVWMGISRLRKARHPVQQAIALAFCLWAALFMGHSAMRLVAPATMLAFAGIGWVLPGDPDPAGARRRRRLVPSRPAARPWVPPQPVRP